MATGELLINTLFGIKDRNRQAMLDAQALPLQQLQMQQMQQGLDLGGLQMQDLQHALDRQPIQDKWQDTINQLELAMKQQAAKSSTMDFFQKKQQFALDNSIFPLEVATKAATLADMMSKAQVSAAQNKDILDHMAASKKFMQEQQNLENSTAYKAQRDIDTLLAGIEEEKPGFHIPTALRSLMAQRYQQGVAKGFDPTELLTELKSFLTADRAQPEAAALPSLGQARLIPNPLPLEQQLGFKQFQKYGTGMQTLPGRP